MFRNGSMQMKKYTILVHHKTKSLSEKSLSSRICPISSPPRLASRVESEAGETKSNDEVVCGAYIEGSDEGVAEIGRMQ